MFNQMIKKSIHKSQHCNRNWDLSKTIPQKDIDLIVESATQCPVKQNLNYYKTHVITDRDKIEKIHEHTAGFFIDNVRHTNSQTLANVLIAFTHDKPTIKREWLRNEPDEHGREEKYMWDQESEKISVDEDRLMAVGIATGYVNLVSTMLGYETGCCKCFDVDPVHEVIGTEFGQPILLMGIGYPDKTRSRLEHHTKGIKFPSLKNHRDVVYHQAA